MGVVKVWDYLMQRDVLHDHPVEIVDKDPAVTEIIAGKLIYNQTTNLFKGFTGTNWQVLGMTASGSPLTASRLVASDGSGNLTSVANLASWVGGTSNQVIVANDGDGTITLSTPQDIATTSAVIFGGLTINGPTVLNEGAGDFDTRIEGQTNANLFFVDASTNRVGIGTATPDSPLEVIGSFRVSDATTATEVINLRTDGAGVDIESGGQDLYLSTWSDATLALPALQRFYLRMSSAASTIELNNNWRWRVGNSTTGTIQHTIDADGGVVLNESGIDADTRIEGQNDNNLIMVDASTDRVGIGTATPAAKLHVKGSNTLGLRIEGTATNELADIYVGSGGQLIISTTAGSDVGGHIDLLPEDDEYGLIIYESDGTGTAVWGNFYVVDAADDYMAIVVDSAVDTDALVVTAANKVGVGMLPSNKFDVAGVAGADNFVSDVATGTQPYAASSTTLNTNLNADLLDSQHGTYYLDSANFTGTNWTDLTDGGTTALHSHAGGGYTTLAQFVDETAWRSFYSNGSGDVTALAFGAAGTVLTSGGASAAPTWSAAGSGTIGGSSGGTDNALIRADGTGGSTIQGSSATATLSDNNDLTLYDATNDGNPVFAFGASATERMTVTPTYDSGAQTLDYVKFATDVASAGADQGLFRFNVDGTDILDIDDGGINFASGKYIATTYKARAYLGSNQLNLTDTTWTKVLLDTENYDPNSNFDTSTSGYTVPVSGYYFLAGQVGFTNFPADTVYAISIAKNGTPGTQLNTAFYHASTTSTPPNALEAGASTVVFLDAADVVYLNVIAYAGVSTVDIDAGSQYTYLSVHLLSID